MDVWHRVGRVVRIANLGTLIFFALNIFLIIVLFCPYGRPIENVYFLVGAYFFTIIISLSPIGEGILSISVGAHEIKRKDIKVRLIPLLEVTYGKAKEFTPSMVNSIKLKIIYDTNPNAVALGRRTVCVTEGLLKLSDEEIMAVFAHELGHIAYGHSVIQLLIGGSNVLISGAILIIKMICWGVSALCGILTSIFTRRLWTGLLVTAVTSVSVFIVWLWTKFCMLFLMWSSRQNEYLADEYAYKLGYGQTLARILDCSLCAAPNGGFLKALYASHPARDDRIARLQDLGVDYYRY